jgi:hypothetical protein
MKWLVYTLVICSTLFGDQSGDLLSAAAKGETPLVQDLIKSGANIEATDKNDRTPLMLAAQHGHAETVRALLAAGAKTDARDKSGLTAYGLAMLDPSGHGSHEAVMKLLPKPPQYRLSVVAAWSPARLVSSCFQRREQIIQEVGLMKPDESLLRELQAFAKSSGKGLARLTQVDDKGVESGRPEPTEDADAIVTLQAEPGSACAGAASDSLTFAINIKVFRARDLLLLSQKSLGGGVKGLRAQTVDNAAQYQPVYQAWLKAQAGPVYWTVVEALMKSAP